MIHFKFDYRYPLNSRWNRWFQEGRQEDSEIYSEALKKCREMNEDLWADKFAREHLTGAVSGPVTSSEPARVAAKEASDPKWAQRAKDTAIGIMKVAKELKPIMDIFVPHSPEYSVPYAFLWIIFKDSVMSIINSLSTNLHIFEAHRDMFPTDEMKTVLAELYIHTVDLLCRLAKYYSHKYRVQLADAFLPRATYNFELYRENIKVAMERLHRLCETGHMAEQKDLRHRIQVIDADMQLEASRISQARHQASDLIDLWHEDVGHVGQELHLWETLHFSTALRDHWSQNGILNCLEDWRMTCDTSESNSILSISSQGNGRQSWMTEFSVDLVRVCQSQGQLVTFAFCDRPRGVKWTPKQLLMQLITQLLHQHPRLAVLHPSCFTSRAFRRTTSYQAAVQLFRSVLSLLDTAVIISDRLDLCTVHIPITTGCIVGPQTLPGFRISFAKINSVDALAECWRQ
ncbi:hypothetical protein QBC35DRAFT_525033 [Podospora australis]|uniref:Uncharacterized protein n=1 Tax=Podospora australis TaxID=1536484 RepID=A0AAN6WN74_9PEZI|nr:hypothetical protein QBC35DRAFT_525033 [Podospora australis]